MNIKRSKEEGGKGNHRNGREKKNAKKETDIEREGDGKREEEENISKIKETKF